MKIAKTRGISSLLSGLKYVETAKNRKESSLFSSLLRIGETEQRVWSQIQENNEKCSNMLTRFRSQNL